MSMYWSGPAVGEPCTHASRVRVVYRLGPWLAADEVRLLINKPHPEQPTDHERHHHAVEEILDLWFKLDPAALTEGFFTTRVEVMRAPKIVDGVRLEWRWETIFERPVTPESVCFRGAKSWEFPFSWASQLMPGEWYRVEVG